MNFVRSIQKYFLTRKMINIETSRKLREFCDDCYEKMPPHPHGPKCPTRRVGKCHRMSDYEVELTLERLS